MILNRMTIAAMAVLSISACANEPATSGAQAAASSRPAPRGAERGERPPMPDLAEAAEKLGVEKDALAQALRDAGGPPPNFEKVAKAIGVSVEDLEAALPPPPERR